MTDTTKPGILVAVSHDDGAEDSGYVEAGERRVSRKLAELKQTATGELVQAIASIAEDLDGATMPASVKGVKVTMGLTVSAEFGISIAGSGVAADVSVEFEWTP